MVDTIQAQVYTPLQRVTGDMFAPFQKLSSVLALLRAQSTYRTDSDLAVVGLPKTLAWAVMPPETVAQYAQGVTS